MSRAVFIEYIRKDFEYATRIRRAPILLLIGRQGADGEIWVADSMQRHDLTVSLDLQALDEGAISKDQTVLLCQSVRELLINASNYSHTDQATIRGYVRNGTLEVQVIDYGKGFEATALLESPSARF